ncbi:MAG: T9SS type A sorting domain-containing protein [Bacteroidetes bacterium]|nr:T9SS type A sorting domain-containing protein [Bacteroidota bacterium]
MYSIYPNPTGEFVNLQSSSNQVTDYIIRDIYNRTVLQGSFVQSSRITLASLPNGIYYIKVGEKASGSSVFKIIKVK